MLTALLFAALAGAPQAPAWTPPPDPDPGAILQEARTDTRAGRYEVALAKFLWFHHHAEERRPGLGAVRLSFALAYWRDLGDRYPPALAAMKRTRNRALSEVRRADGGQRLFSAFHDFASLNEYLEEESLTVRAFLELDKGDPEAAAVVFHVAERALVRANAYDVCGKYVRPDQSWETTAELYRMDKKLEERARADHPKSADKFFTSRVTMLLAVLVVNGRPEEAQAIAEKARRELDDPAFRAAIDSALRGVVPEPWP